MVIETGSLAGTQKGINPLWPMTTALLVQIYRDESLKMKILDSYNEPTGTPTTDEDDEDFD